ncbi:N-acetyltransferase [Aliishimia ponticola]|uniref:N-acetyltransferase n=1 Tax=Aliishimia ponticola TaxID=2499833 RepID=A0A4S4N9N7_9RHOB|nr:GNAT family N-acetyltransferase [Aliishimia ponticola]THH35087.1 N-acetyltransferase [Aliishimia ponticola]
MTIALSNTPALETERLILRAPQADDWPQWRAMTRSERSRFIRAADMTDGLAWRAMGHIIGHWVLRGWGNFVITRKGDNTALGMTGPWFPQGWPEPEIGWSIWSAEVEGTGIAFEAAQAARDFAFGTLGWQTAVSYIVAENTRSIALAERLGARLDPTADHPKPAQKKDTDETVLVYRHPKPEAA